jgi:hypothetical protein
MIINFKSPTLNQKYQNIPHNITTMNPQPKFLFFWFCFIFLERGKNVKLQYIIGLSLNHTTNHTPLTVRPLLIFSS